MNAKPMFCMLLLVGSTALAQAQGNELANPGFHTDLSGWIHLVPRPASWDPLDAQGSSTSGSARLTNTLNPSNGAVPTVLRQCIPVSARQQYEYGGKMRVQEGQPAQTTAYISLLVHPDANCSGESLVFVSVGSSEVATWISQGGSVVVPEGGASIQIAMGLAKPIGVTADASGHFDDIYLRLASGAGSFPIDHRLSGSWFDPATPGQGFFIDVAPAINLFFAGWYTWTDTPGVYDWMTAQGDYSGDTALVPLVRTQGGVFLAPVPVTNTPVGWAEFRFMTCTDGQLTFEFSGMGPPTVIPLRRLTPAPPGCGDD